MIAAFFPGSNVCGILHHFRVRALALAAIRFSDIFFVVFPLNSTIRDFPTCPWLPPLALALAWEAIAGVDKPTLIPVK